MTLKKSPEKPHFSPNEIIENIAKNSKLFSDYISTAVLDPNVWDLKNTSEFKKVLMASSSFYAQKLFNSFIELSNTPMQSQAEVNEAISNWIGVLMESTIINFVLANTLVDMSNEETKSTFYSLMYEFLNSATTDEPKTIH